MRYLTPALVHGDIEGEQAKHIWQAYEAHLNKLWPHLSPDLRVLAKTEIHDALIRRIVLDHSAHELVLELRCGWVKVGYFDLNLHYRGITLSDANTEVIRMAASCPASEVKAQEIDRGPNGEYIHRLLVAVNDDNDDDVMICFRQLEMENIARTDRIFEEQGSRFLEIPDRGC